MCIRDSHYMWDHYYDLGGCRLPEILCMDIESLQKLHLDGFISCQITRCQFPTGLGQNLMGRALWQGSVEYEKIRIISSRDHGCGHFHLLQRFGRGLPQAFGFRFGKAARK